MNRGVPLEEDDDRLIRLGKEYLELVERMKEEARRDPMKQPTPSFIAARLGITVDEALQLHDFAYNELGEYEAQVIAESVGEYLDMDGMPMPEFEQ